MNKTTDILEKREVEVAKTTDKLADRTNSMEESMYQVECVIDEMQQYSRRDCLEITGIPVLSDDSPKQLVKKTGFLTDVEINDNNIAAAHRLPDTAKAKHRMFVKLCTELKGKKCTRNVEI